MIQSVHSLIYCFMRETQIQLFRFLLWVRALSYFSFQLIFILVLIPFIAQWVYQNSNKPVLYRFKSVSVFDADYVDQIHFFLNARPTKTAYNLITGPAEQYVNKPSYISSKCEFGVLHCAYIFPDTFSLKYFVAKLK